MKKILVLAMLATASAAQAQTWIEIPDAPAAAPFTAQMTVGVGPLTTIRGGGDFAGDSVDAYCIHIFDVGAFSATTVRSSLAWLGPMPVVMLRCLPPTRRPPTSASSSLEA